MLGNPRLIAAAKRVLPTVLAGPSALAQGLADKQLQLPGAMPSSAATNLLPDSLQDAHQPEFEGLLLSP